MIESLLVGKNFDETKIRQVTSGGRKDLADIGFAVNANSGLGAQMSFDEFGSHIYVAVPNHLANNTNNIVGAIVSFGLEGPKMVPKILGLGGQVNGGFGTNVAGDELGNICVAGLPKRNITYNYGGIDIVPKTSNARTYWGTYPSVEQSRTQAMVGSTVFMSLDGKVFGAGATGFNTGINSGSGAVLVWRRDDQGVISGGGTYRLTTLGYQGEHCNISGNGKILAMSNSGGGIRVLDISQDSSGGITTQFLTVPQSVIDELGDQFTHATIGTSIRLSEDGKVICYGYPNYQSGRGLVMVYKLNDSGVYEFDQYLRDTEHTFNTRFGSRIDLSKDGTKLVVAAGNGNSTTTVGAAYVYETGEDNKFALRDKITNGVVGFGFGIAISSSGNRMAVSDNQSNIYIYKL